MGWWRIRKRKGEKDKERYKRKISVKQSHQLDGLDETKDTRQSKSWVKIDHICWIKQSEDASQELSKTLKSSVCVCVYKRFWALSHSGAYFLTASVCLKGFTSADVHRRILLTVSAFYGVFLLRKRLMAWNQHLVKYDCLWVQMVNIDTDWNGSGFKMNLCKCSGCAEKLILSWYLTELEMCQDGPTTY